MSADGNERSRRRFRFQWSLRTCLALVAVVAVGLTILGPRLRDGLKRRQAIAWARSIDPEVDLEESATTVEISYLTISGTNVGKDFVSDLESFAVVRHLAFRDCVIDDAVWSDIAALRARGGVAFKNCTFRKSSAAVEPFKTVQLALVESTPNEIARSIVEAGSGGIVHIRPQIGETWNWIEVIDDFAVVVTTREQLEAMGKGVDGVRYMYGDETTGKLCDR